MLGPDNGGLGKKSVANPSFNVLDLLNGLLFGEAIQEQVDIGSRAELLMVELAKAAFGTVVLLRDGQEAVDNG
jgi:hypothetical protein